MAKLYLCGTAVAGGQSRIALDARVNHCDCHARPVLSIAASDERRARN